MYTYAFMVSNVTLLYRCLNQELDVQMQRKCILELQPLRNKNKLTNVLIVNKSGSTTRMTYSNIHCRGCLPFHTTWTSCIAIGHTQSLFFHFRILSSTQTYSTVIFTWRTLMYSHYAKQLKYTHLCYTSTRKEKNTRITINDIRIYREGSLRTLTHAYTHACTHVRTQG